MRRTFAVLAALVLLRAPAPARAEFIIDTFQTPNPAATFIGPTAAVNVTHAGTGILGTRTFTTSTSLVAGDAAIIGNGTLQVFAGIGTFTSSLSYLFPGAQDLSSFPGVDFVFDFLDGGALPATDVQLTLFSGPGGPGPSQSFATTFADVPLGSTTTRSISLGGFNAAILGNVTALRVDFNNSGSPQAGVDFILTQISAVPEPASLTVWGLVGVAGAWYGRRLKRRTAARRRSSLLCP